MKKMASFCMKSIERDLLNRIFTRITPATSHSERAELVIDALLDFGAELRSQPALEEIKGLFLRIAQFKRTKNIQERSSLAV